MRPSYNSNFTKGYLLLNLPIEIYFEGYSSPIIMRLPSVEEVIGSNKIIGFINLLDDKEL